MSKFKPAVLAMAAKQREVGLTTQGRATGKPSRVVIWVSPGDEGTLYIRSGGGLGRHWTRNIMARNEGVLHLEGHDVSIRVRHVTDPGEARRVSGYVRSKYGEGIQVSGGDEPLTPGELASFELLPV